MTNASGIFYRIGAGDPEPLASWAQAAELITTTGVAAVTFLRQSDPLNLRREVIVTREKDGYAAAFTSVVGDMPMPSIRVRTGVPDDQLFRGIEAFLAPVRRPSEPDDEPTEPARRRGSVRVHTVSGSRYEIDFDAMRLRRLPSEPSPQGPDAPESACLRRDFEWVKMLRVIRLVVGESAVFRLEPLGHPRAVAFTTRATTRVLMIEPLAE
ncbi:hypothetical protein [Diaminobutyricimonas sp. LJ205]|uniref:hypothetical protein n=1 Tax=Diaminobutyricimonas sp. LJ205 TaxID=2683590 RepID=UPI0012F4ADE2|nr:hypothetical protein [Diaminobutyricimonas sp. LJ205]